MDKPLRPICADIFFDMINYGVEATEIVPTIYTASLLRITRIGLNMQRPTILRLGNYDLSVRS